MQFCFCTLVVYCVCVFSMFTHWVCQKPTSSVMCSVWTTSFLWWCPSLFSVWLYCIPSQKRYIFVSSVFVYKKDLNALTMESYCYNNILILYLVSNDTSKTHSSTNYVLAHVCPWFSRTLSFHKFVCLVHSSNINNEFSVGNWFKHIKKRIRLTTAKTILLFSSYTI